MYETLVHLEIKKPNKGDASPIGMSDVFKKEHSNADGVIAYNHWTLSKRERYFSQRGNYQVHREKNWRSKDLHKFQERALN